MRTLLSALIATVAVAAVPAVAGAQSGFTDYRQAAGHQYDNPPGNPPPNNTPGNPPSNPPPNNPPGGGVSPGNSGNTPRPNRNFGNTPRPNNNPPSGGARPGTAGRDPGLSLLGARDVQPLAVSAPSSTITLKRGTLPFTGGALGTLVLVGLALLAAGFLLAAISRARRLPV